MKRYKWKPQRLKADMSEPALPVPRLEIRWHRENDLGAVAVYSLVYRHLCNHDVRVFLGRTEVTGVNAGAFDRLSMLDTPFRDGAHILHDMKLLRLRAFVSFNLKWRELLPEVAP